jgi:hypothetical protein
VAHGIPTQGLVLLKHFQVEVHLVLKLHHVYSTNSSFLSQTFSILEKEVLHHTPFQDARDPSIKKCCIILVSYDKRKTSHTITFSEMKCSIDEVYKVLFSARFLPLGRKEHIVIKIQLCDESPALYPSCR